MAKRWVSCVLALLVVLPGRVAAETEVVISTARAGGGYHTIGGRLAELFAGQGVAARVVESAGSMENLGRLSDPASPVNVAMTQADALQHYLERNPDFKSKYMVLDEFGKECVFIIAGGESGLKADADLKSNPKGAKIAILSPESGTAVTYQLMSVLEPGFKNTEVVYTDPYAALQALKDGTAEAQGIGAVMLVSHPKARPPEMTMVLKNPSDLHFVQVDGPGLDGTLPGGGAAYSYEELNLREGPGWSNVVTVKTICTERLIVASTQKLDADEQARIHGLVQKQWMDIY